MLNDAHWWQLLKTDVHWFMCSDVGYMLVVLVVHGLKHWHVKKQVKNMFSSFGPKKFQGKMLVKHANWFTMPNENWITICDPIEFHWTVLKMLMLLPMSQLEKSSVMFCVDYIVHTRSVCHATDCHGWPSCSVHAIFSTLQIVNTISVESAQYNGDMNTKQGNHSSPNTCNEFAAAKDNRRNLAEINRLRQAVSLLHNKLEVGGETVGVRCDGVGSESDVVTYPWW